MRTRHGGFVLRLALVLSFSLLGKCGMAGDATVYRDTWGVPHIWADDFASAGYAIGQAQCEDSLTNVVYCLYAGVGRLAELLGPGLLNSDIEARTLRHRFYVERDWPKLDRRSRDLIEGFCAGVNDYITKHPEELLVPVKPIAPVQVLAWQRSLLLRSAVGIVKGDAEASKADGFQPDYKPGDEHSDKPGRTGIKPGKSNSWALAGTKTANGAPMLLIDPHWMAEGHLQLYEFWLHIPGEMEVGGFGLAGTPIPGLGVTPYAAWTVTAGGADSSDAYALKLNPARAHEYEFDGEWLKMDVQRESISVRQPNGETIVREIEVLETRHGPVLKTSTGVPYAAALGGYRRGDLFDQYLLMSTAQSTKDFKRSIALNRISYFNLMWITREGDIGFAQTGQAPLRPAGFNWQKMVPGWTTASMYTRHLTFAEHPTVENPVSGFLQNCNVAANVVTPGQIMKQGDFPPGVLYGHYGLYRARGARATQLLTQVRNASLEDGKRIAFDSYVPPADIWIPILLQGWKEYAQSVPADQLANDTNQQLQRAVRLLGEWNRYADRQSVGATLFRFWRFACFEMANTRAGRDAFHIENTKQVRRDAIAALQAAIVDLVGRFGKLAVPWGDVKRLRRGTQEWPLSGDGLGKLGMDSLRATAADTFNGENKLIPKGGQCVTSIVSLTNPPTIRAVVTYGQSNKPLSRHFDDQAPLFSNEQLRSVPWTREQLAPNIESTTQWSWPQD
ncbi:MAG: penicillin acylase family protein [Planctomycetota bacterium]|nr:penicillin acylase family protein [Planctomycetota bacterium]